MQIFFLDEDPEICAKTLWMLSPLHANKQIVELCQMMAQLTDTPVPKINGGFYAKKASIKNHPATKWIARNDSNFKWADKFLVSLLMYYFQKRGIQHGCHLAWEAIRIAYLKSKLNRLENGVLKNSKSPPKFEWLSSANQLDYHPDLHIAYNLYLDKKLWDYYVK